MTNKPFITKDEDRGYYHIKYRDRIETITTDFVADISELWNCPEEKVVQYIANFFVRVVDEGAKAWWRKP